MGKNLNKQKGFPELVLSSFCLARSDGSPLLHHRKTQTEKVLICQKEKK
jgi:hypothetical protein